MARLTVEGEKNYEVVRRVRMFLQSRRLVGLPQLLRNRKPARVERADTSKGSRHLQASTLVMGSPENDE